MSLSKILIENFFSLIQISGPEAKIFLQGQLLCDLNLLENNTSTLTGYCNNQGRLISVLRVYVLEDLKLDQDLRELDLDLTRPVYLLRCPQELSPILLTELQKYGQFSDVEIRVLKQPMKNAWQRLWILSKEPWSESLESWFEWQIEHLIPEVFASTTGQFLPHDLGLHQIEQAISFNKGCYRGQEIVARMQYRGHLKKHLETIRFKTPSLMESIHLYPGNKYSDDMNQGILINATERLGLLLQSRA